MNILLASEIVDYAANSQNTLSAVEIVWNLSQHTYRGFPHYNRFHILSGVTGQTDDSTIQKSIAVLEILRLEITRNKTMYLLQKVFNIYHRYNKSLTVDHPNQKVWFYQKDYKWRIGIVVFINRSIATVKFGIAVPPTYNHHICSFFSKNFISSEIVENDSDDLELPKTINDDEAQGTLADAHVEPNRHISNTQLILTVDIQPIFNLDTSFDNNTDHGAVDSETTITRSLR